MRSGLADPEGVDVVPAVERRRDVLEAQRFARQRDAAVGVEPVLLVVLREFAHPLAHRVGQAGLAREGRVDLDGAVVDRLLLPVELHLDDAEVGVDRLEERAVALLSLALRRACSLQLAQPQPDGHLTHESARQIRQCPLVLGGPGARLTVDCAERADDAAVRQRERSREVGDDATVFDGGAALHPRIAHGQGQPRLEDRSAEGVRRRRLAQAGPGLGQALGAEKELPVGIQQGDERHRDA